jgi:MFS family permease
MTQQIRAIAAVLFSIFIFLVGSGLVSTLIPVRGDLAGFNDLAIGLIGAAYYAGFVIGCYVSPGMLARSGHIRTFAVAAGLAAAAVLVQSMLIDEPVWVIARLGFGFSAACIYTVTESWLNDRASNETRGHILALYLSISFGGLVIGQWLYTTAAPTSYVLFSVAAIFYALCLVPVGLTRLPQPVPAEVPQLRLRRFYRIAPVGVAGCAAVGFANGAVWTLAPVYAHDHHITNVLLAAFMSAFTLAGALVQVPAGRLSDLMDRRYLIALMSALAGAAGLALALFGGLNEDMTILLFAVYGGMSLPIYGLSVAHTNDWIPREDFVEASATLLLVNALASVMGPILAATITTHTTTAALFMFAAGIHITHVLFVGWRITRREAPEEEFREPYAAVSHQVSPVSLELDPRGPDTDEPVVLGEEEAGEEAASEEEGAKKTGAESTAPAS